MKKLYLLIAIILGCIQFANGQGAYYTAITVTEPHNIAQTNFPVLITVNTQALISAGQMQATGADIRFATDASCPLTATYLSYYIESGINTANTKIWVRVPSLTAGGTDELYMSYGDPAAVAMSSFASVFPSAVIVTTGNTVTLSGTQNVGWLQVDAGGTLAITAGSTLTILAEKVIINGTVDGNGRGFAVGALNATGNGPGAGTVSPNLGSGSGGGSYGGVGGTGGMDVGDNPGVGGAIYGTATGADIDMGSSGGSGTTAGGAGGGCLSILSNDVTLNGTINMNGAAGASTASRGGGGGAGGGILIRAKTLTGTGSLSAMGGAGGQGTSTFNDGGGGGGGGRIKLFTENTPGITTNVTGGVGGGFGDAASGQPGGVGTANTIATTFIAPTFGIQTPAFVTPAVSISASPSTNVCPGGSVTFTATPTNQGTGATYQWFKNGILQAATGTTYTDNVFTTGTSVICIMQTTGVCTGSPVATSNALTMTVLPTVTSDVTITALPGTAICTGNSVTFTANAINAGTPTYQWFKDNVLQAATGSTYTDNGLTNGNTIKCVITPSGVCPTTPTDTSNIVTMTVNPNVTPDVTIAANNGTTICAGNSVTFTATPADAGTPTYQWFKDDVLQAATGNTYTDNGITNGNAIKCVITAVGVCTTTPVDTSNILTMTVNPTVAPDVTISGNPSGAICEGMPASFLAIPTNGGTTPAFQWFKNNVLQAATGSVYEDNVFANGDMIKCVLTSNEQCPLPATDTSNNITMNITAATNVLAGAAGTTEINNAVIIANTDMKNTDCDLMATIMPSGGSPVNTNTVVRVTIDNTVNNYNGAPYLQRHYDIEPDNATPTTSATITLYAYQSEFDAYNAAAWGHPPLPSGGVDNGNVKITQFHGTGTAPGNYTGAAELIIPTVSWDATNNWWEMTFDVTGFSGFYIHTAWTNNPLAITLKSINATNIGAANRITWETATEDKGDAFTLERSIDGKTFSAITSIPAKGISSAYTYDDERPATGVNYYRLKMTDAGNNVTYSSIVTARMNASHSTSLQAYPNPAKDKLTVEVTGIHSDNGIITITDIMGRTVQQTSFKGDQMLIDISNLAAGSYIIKYTDATNTSTIKINKE